MSLERFHRAQSSRVSGYAAALEELRAGQKTSHWIWYVFPQIEGLGRSSMAQEFALRGLAEAEEYLRDPVLRGRYLESAEVVEQQLARGVPIEQLMGGAIDAQKLVSSLTLFRAAAEKAATSDNDPVFAQLAQVAASALKKAAAQNYPACEFTLARWAE